MTLAPLPAVSETPLGSVGRAPQAGPGGARVKPLLRGWLHLAAVPVAMIAGAILLGSAPPGRIGIAEITYVATLVALFGSSALYHVPNWPPGKRQWLKRVDHSAIFFLVAGTYTPFARLLPAAAGHTLVIVGWSGAALGSLATMFWPQAPKPVSAVTYVLLGWMGLWFLPQIEQSLGPLVLFWILAGGVLYTLGAVAYALRRPDPWPAVFGYHEIFHALIICAAACHFVAVALTVRLDIPR
jgi:hemolysin III